MPEPKTPGQLAYEEDVRRRPLYDHGEPRDSWDQLVSWKQDTWHKDPTAREHKTYSPAELESLGQQNLFGEVKSTGVALQSPSGRGKESIHRI